MANSKQTQSNSNEIVLSNDSKTTLQSHHLEGLPGLTHDEFVRLMPCLNEFHANNVKGGECSSLIVQKIHAPLDVVWSIVRRFDKPQTFKHFVKSCSVSEGFTLTVGATRNVRVVTGIPAETSIERLEILDDDRHVIGFTIIGGMHRLVNYHSVMTVHTLPGASKEDEWTVVLESYGVDVPEGNTEEETRVFVDMIVKLNLQKLGSVAAKLARERPPIGGASNVTSRI